MAINQIGIPYQQGFTHTSYLHGAMMAYWLDEKFKPEVDKAIEKLRNLPGPDGADGDTGGNALKGLNPTGGYNSFAEFAKDVYLADLKGAQTSAKFDKWMTDIRDYRNVMNEAKTAGTPTLELGDPEQGGYLAARRCRWR
jgi:hypothetical protein